MRSRRSPQQKKRLSYAKDRRNTYGERGANSRFAIAESKAIARRSNRRSADAALKVVSGAQGETGLVVAESRARTLAKRGKRFAKVPDEPLAVAVAAKLARRERVGMTTKKSRATKP